MFCIETDVELTRGGERVVRERLPEDSGGIVFRANVYKNGNPADLSGYACWLHAMKSGGEAGERTAGTVRNGCAEAVLPEGALDTPGEARFTLRLYKGGERVTLATLIARVG